MTKTYAQIAREIATLQATADKLYAAELGDAVAKVNDIIAKYNLSASDLRFAEDVSPTSSAPSAGKGMSARAAKYAQGAKYRNDQGQSWSGRGPRPGWLRSAIAAGRSLESFLVSVTGTARATPQASTAHAASTKLSVPKYRDPKSGVTWSGRGPRPQWLKAALRKRGSAIDQFLIGASTPVVSGKEAVLRPKTRGSAKATAVRESSGKASIKKTARAKRPTAGRAV